VLDLRLAKLEDEIRYINMREREEIKGEVDIGDQIKQLKDYVNS
jgi:hypothetical protein